MTDYTQMHGVMLAMYMSHKLHEKQKYGDEPYFDAHICKVVDIIKQFGGTDEDVIAGYLHDAIEDTDMTRRIVEIMFGTRVSSKVYACTGEGKNRKERNACIYKRIEQYPDAAFIKVADRIANLESAGEKHKEMYRKEKDDFFNNVAVHVSPEMQERLNQAYN